MLTRGRPAAKPEITGVRELTRAEVLSVRRGREPAVKELKDSHHLVARLFAMGLRPSEVAFEAGYSLGRVSTLRADPSFQELIAFYRADENAAFREKRDNYYDFVIANRNLAARHLNDRLSDEEQAASISTSQLIAISADGADRTGYVKRSVNVNVNADFTQALEAAIKRTREEKARRELAAEGKLIELNPKSEAAE